MKIYYKAKQINKRLNFTSDGYYVYIYVLGNHVRQMYIFIKLNRLIFISNIKGMHVYIDYLQLNALVEKEVLLSCSLFFSSGNHETFDKIKSFNNLIKCSPKDFSLFRRAHCDS